MGSVAAAHVAGGQTDASCAVHTDDGNEREIKRHQKIVCLTFEQEEKHSVQLESAEETPPHELLTQRWSVNQDDITQPLLARRQTDRRFEEM